MLTTNCCTPIVCVFVRKSGSHKWTGLRGIVTVCLSPDGACPLALLCAAVRCCAQVAPSKFSGDALDVLTAQIEAKFADRVIANVGLCICLHSYESIGDPYVYPSDGAAHYKV